MIKEEWKEIKDYPDYKISNLGRVMSLKSNIILTPRKGKKKNYHTVAFYRSDRDKPKSMRVHRLVAIYFLENPNNHPQVNHIDGNKQNNRVDNLEWCTNKQNCIHAVNIGLIDHSMKGEKHPACKLTNEIVHTIRAKYKRNVYGCYRLAKEFNMSLPSIKDIISRRTWSHI